MPTYRVQYMAAGRSVTVDYTSSKELAVGTFVTINSVFLFVERIIRPKRGDPHDGLALCKIVPG